MITKIEANYNVNELMEKAAVDLGHSENMDRIVQISIAISLKRIADKLEVSSKQSIIMTAEEYKIFKNEGV